VTLQRGLVYIGDACAGCVMKLGQSVLVLAGREPEGKGASQNDGSSYIPLVPSLYSAQNLIVKGRGKIR